MQLFDPVESDLRARQVVAAGGGLWVTAGLTIHEPDDGPTILLRKGGAPAAPIALAARTIGPSTWSAACAEAFVAIDAHTPELRAKLALTSPATRNPVVRGRLGGDEVVGVWYGRFGAKAERLVSKLRAAGLEAQLRCGRPMIDEVLSDASERGDGDAAAKCLPAPPEDGVVPVTLEGRVAAERSRHPGNGSTIDFLELQLDDDVCVAGPSTWIAAVELRGPGNLRRFVGQRVRVRGGLFQGMTAWYPTAFSVDARDIQGLRDR